MSDKEQRARKAHYELEITAEATDKLKAHWIKQAVEFAAAGKQAEAHNLLLKINALETVRQMVHVPIDDWTIERKLAEAKAPQPSEKTN
jgi:hypothetical protein